MWSHMIFPTAALNSRPKALLYSWDMQVGMLTGRSLELGEVLKQRVNMVCVQETKWKGCKAKMLMEGYQIYYSRSWTSQNNVGVILDEIMHRDVTEMTRRLDQLMSVKWCWEEETIHLVSRFSPTVRRGSKDEREVFDDLCLIGNMLPNEKIIIGADLNAHVGTTKAGYEIVHGGHSFGSRNSEGKWSYRFVWHWTQWLQTHISEEGMPSHNLCQWRTQIPNCFLFNKKW